ncbi:C-C chemokine receptor type 3-like [Spea bombifrons]|uniref:C-C chemokine receptor type 3-like n=1 Tax=Spea bombifrons TaxID=233779 RepID=UPI00234BC30E|nr:C-C chemokine receptor type 3-like [Spea bombifrons]
MPDFDSDLLTNFTTVKEDFTTASYDEEEVVLCQNTNIMRFGAVTVPFFYYSVFILSLVGNSLILFLLLKYEKIKTVTNLFIFNLVISDLMFTISLPFWAFYHKYEWIFGDGLCKILSSVFHTGFFSRILFLTMISVDRYLAVVHAVSAARTRRLLYAYVASIVIWAISLLSTVPKFVLYGTRNHYDAGIVCEETGYTAEKMDKWKLFGYYQQIIMFFIIPLIVILYCYSLIVIKLVHTKMYNKDKAMKLILVIVLAFFICWTPYNVVICVKTIHMSKKSPNVDCDNNTDYAFYICRNIAYFHCCINPFLYTFVGTKFRRHLSTMLRKQCTFRSKYRNSSLSSKASEYSPQTIYE